MKYARPDSRAGIYFLADSSGDKRAVCHHSYRLPFAPRCDLQLALMESKNYISLFGQFAVKIELGSTNFDFTEMDKNGCP